MSYLKELLKENENVLGKNCVDGDYDIFEKKVLNNPNFSNAIPIMQPQAQQGIFRQLMQIDVNSKDKRSLYIHIPFCKTECSYCGFYLNPKKESVMQEYVDALITEINMAKAYGGIKNKPFHCIYFGGGTPTELEPEQIQRIMDAIRENFTFSADCEFTVESRFSSISDEKIETWVKAGMNRISLGVQSFDTNVRRKLGRINKKEAVLETLKKLVDDGRFTVVVDLMYGLPYQTFEIWQEDIRLLIESGVDGADIYQLVLYKNSQLRNKIDEGKIPYDFSNKEKFLFFEYAVKTLEEHSFVRLSTQHFAKDTRERNFYNFFAKNMASTFQLGSAAGGRWDGHSIMNHRDINKYLESAKEGNKPIAFMAKDISFSPLSNAIEVQMLKGYLNTKLLKELCQSPEEFELLLEIIKYLEDRKILEQKNDSVYNLTVLGQFWYTNLTLAIIDIIDKFIKKGKRVNLKEEIAKKLEENPDLTPGMLAKEFDVKEFEILTNLPQEVAKAVEGSKFDEIIQEVRGWGELLFVKITPSFVIEFKTNVANGTYGRGYYNFDMKDSAMGGHLKASDIEKIIFVSKKHMGILAHAIEFYDKDGEHIFKLFLTRNEKREILPEQLEAFKALKEKM